jgi:ferredoxin
MATIKTRTRNTSAIDGGSMESAAEVGVQFGCHRGVCGRCATDVVSGLENLSALSEAEQAMDLDPARRLMCQCTISGGTVELDLE